MKSKFIEQLKQLKPTSREEVKVALAKNRSNQGGAVAFESELLQSVQLSVPNRKWAKA
jgi:hypothetical protein